MGFGPCGFESRPRHSHTPHLSMKKNQTLPDKSLLDQTFIADLHIHSKYSRACSKFMDIPHISKTAQMKGLDLVGTGDFTHPEWFKELKEQLEYDPETGFYSYKNNPQGPKFVLTTEISLIFSTKHKKNRRVHLVLIAPNFEVAEEINLLLSRFGNLSIDGRPTFGLSCETLAKEIIKISPDILIIPAHVWTPWYSLFGAFSGFDSIEEAFGDYTPYIYAIETGLSSDPEMNWRISALDPITLISCSDAHSPAKLGREATGFYKPFTYSNMVSQIKQGNLAFTIEFYPEEGKYHYDGHRNCKISLSPKETKALGYKCPVCGNPITIGVLHRIETLADREEGFVPKNRPLSIHLVPLNEILSEVFNVSLNTKTIQKLYEKYVQDFGNEFNLILRVPLEELKENLPEKLYEAIKRVREGKVYTKPGYDGEYGTVKVFGEEKESQKILKQSSLFSKI